MKEQKYKFIVYPDRYITEYVAGDRVLIGIYKIINKFLKIPYPNYKENTYWFIASEKMKKGDEVEFLDNISVKLKNGSKISKKEQD